MFDVFSFNLPSKCFSVSFFLSWLGWFSAISLGWSYIPTLVSFSLKDRPTTERHFYSLSIPFDLMGRVGKFQTLETKTVFVDSTNILLNDTLEGGVLSVGHIYGSGASILREEKMQKCQARILFRWGWSVKDFQK